MSDTDLETETLSPTAFRTFQRYSSEYDSNGSRFFRTLSRNIIGSCGMIERFFRIVNISCDAVSLNFYGFPEIIIKMTSS